MWCASGINIPPPTTLPLLEIRPFVSRCPQRNLGWDEYTLASVVAASKAGARLRGAPCGIDGWLALLSMLLDIDYGGRAAGMFVACTIHVC